jgi:hypothetical protein
MSDARQQPTEVPAPPGRAYEAVVVGAGFAGLYMLHRLRGLGLSARASWPPMPI